MKLIIAYLAGAGAANVVKGSKTTEEAIAAGLTLPIAIAFFTAAYITYNRVR